MSDVVSLWEVPEKSDYLIAGWNQWADAGDVSSGLPKYLIDFTSARMIGEMSPDNFYLFQIPGAHHLLRPVVNLKDGHRESLERRRNEFFYAGEGGEPFVVFLGEEPNLDERGYAEAFFDAVEALGVKKVAALGGVHAPVPHDKERDVSCVYSLPAMKSELAQYAVRFSDYEGGSTISTYLADRAEERNIEFFSFYVLVPAYDFSSSSLVSHQVAVDQDYKAWHGVMRRLDHLFGLNLDLSDLARLSNRLVAEWDSKLAELDEKMPQLDIKEYLQQVNEEFIERRFMPFSGLWEEALGDALEDL